MSSLVYKLEEMGVKLDYQEDGIRVSAEGDLKPVDVKHYPPWFPYRYAISNDGIIINCQWP